MRKKWIAAVAVSMAMLAGCSSLPSGNYVSVTPHKEKTAEVNDNRVSAVNYRELVLALEDFIGNAVEQGMIYVNDYESDSPEQDIQNAVDYLLHSYALGAYAVDTIEYTLGTNGGQDALAISIKYCRSKTEISNIVKVSGISEAKQAIADALDAIQTDVVLEFSDYSAKTDIDQLVEDYADQYPERVMEKPEVSVGVFPDTTNSRPIVEIKFAYQTSRDSLRNMLSQARPVFDSAVLYVSGDGAEAEKFDQLYSFLMERYDYRIERSLTPAYSLLRHGVGDAEAFAVVYSAMCRLAGLKCTTVSGSRNGEAWYWNMVQDGSEHYHVDLLRCLENGKFSELADSQMEDYVWDYSAYPNCDHVKEATETDETLPTEIQ